MLKTTSSNVSTTQISGVLPVSSGGTGLNSLTANYIPYGNGTVAFSSSSLFTFNGTSFIIGATSSTAANNTTTGSTFFNGSISMRNRGASAGIGGQTYANQLISSNGTGVDLEIYTIGASNNNLVFGTNSAERMRISTAGGVSIGNTTDPGATNLSVTGSLTLAGGTPLTNYTEGTWTPTQGSGLTVVGAFSSVGRYIRVGRQVTLIGSVSGATSISCSAGGLLTAGAPFSQANVFGTGTAVNGTFTSGSNLFISGTSIYSTTVMSGSTIIYFTITYFTP